VTFPGVHARTRPDHPAIVMATSGETVTYRELDERSNRLAHLWYERGLRRGDHVAILLQNDPRWFDAVWAALRSGLYYTPVNWHLTAPEVAYIVADCGARSVLTSVHLAEQVRDLVGGDIKVEIPLVVDGALDGWEDYQEAVAGQPATPLDHEPEGAGMFYSSGTTGRPKGILFPLADRTAADEHPLMVYKSPIAPRPGTVYLSPAPMYHTAPVVSCSLVHRVGGTTVVMERWDPEACLAAIERYRCTQAQFVPTMFVRMLKLPPEVRERYDLSSLEQVTHAAAPCPVEVKRQMMDWLGPIIWEYYAGSENAGSTLIDPQEWLAHPGSVGLPRMCTVHICDDDHRELPVGEVGNIWFDAPATSFEYHGDPEKTAAGRSPEGWYSIGDVGYLDDEGYLYLTDRQSFTIISGGVNIYPQEAEDVLVMHPAVADVAVFGVPDEDLGEQVKGVVQLLDPTGAGPDLEAELLAFCRQHLAAFKCPRSIDFTDALPRQDTGKLYKRLLKDRYWGDRASRIV
jgi:long-chain acyl-CoA synthetase